MQSKLASWIIWISGSLLAFVFLSSLFFDREVSRPSLSEEKVVVSDSPSLGQAVPDKASPHSKHDPSQKVEMPKIERPPIDPTVPLVVDREGRYVLDWDVLFATKFEAESKPAFPENLKAADQQNVVLTGYMCPLDEVGGMSNFLLLEVPVGCFYCVPPLPTGIVFIELEGDHRESMRYEPVKILGTFSLNASDPEDFLYSIRNATVNPSD